MTDGQDRHVRRPARRAAGDVVRLFGGLGLGLTGPFAWFATLLSIAVLPVGGLGVPVFLAVTWAVRRVADLMRRWVAVERPYAQQPAGVLPRFRVVAREAATWRDLGWLLAQFVMGLAGAVVGVGLWLLVLECVTAPVVRLFVPASAGFQPVVLEIVGGSGPLTWLAVPVGVALAFVAYRAPRHLIAAQDALARTLLAPNRSARLSERVARLATARHAAVDVAAVELRRVERDLHDGAQVRLVALAMHLGMAEAAMDTDPEGARQLLAEAKTSAGTALTELRDLVRGIHPPLLAERGLAAAVEDLSLSCGVPVRLDLRLPGRLAAPVESAAYFVIAESLANAARHSAARQVRLTVDHDGTALRITVLDDGVGGADPSAGSGLLGIRRRLAAFDGTLAIDSPTGGPTELRMELPCGS